MKDIKSLLAKAKFGTDADKTIYTEAVISLRQTNPADYLSSLKYIIASGVGLNTLSTFVTEHANLPLVAIRAINEAATEILDKANNSSNVDATPYRVLVENSDRQMDQHQSRLAMFESFEESVERDYVEYAFSGPHSTEDVLNRFGAAALPDCLLGCFGESVNEVMEAANSHIVFAQPGMKQWLVEASRDMVEDGSLDSILFESILSQSIEGRVNDAINSRTMAYRESVLSGNGKNPFYSYDDEDVTAFAEYAAFQEHMVVTLRTNDDIVAANRKAIKAHSELDGHVDEACADIAAMLPTGQRDTTVIKEARVSGNVPDFIKKKHDVSYGEDDLLTNKSKQYEREKKPATPEEDEADVIDPNVISVADMDKFDKLAGETIDDLKNDKPAKSSDGAKAANNYYYNYYNSFNRTRHDDHSTHDLSTHKNSNAKDDHSTNKQTSKGVSTKSVTESFTITFDNMPDIVTEGFGMGHSTPEVAKPVESPIVDEVSRFGFNITAGTLSKDEISEKLVTTMRKQYHDDVKRIIKLVEKVATDEHQILGNVEMTAGLDTMWTDLYHIEEMLLSKYGMLVFSADNGRDILYEHIIGSTTFDKEKVTVEKVLQLMDQYKIKLSPELSNYINSKNCSEWDRVDWGKLATEIFDRHSMPVLQALALPANSVLTDVFDGTSWDDTIGANIRFTDIRDTVDAFNKELGDSGSVTITFEYESNVTESTDNVLDIAFSIFTEKKKDDKPTEPEEYDPANDPERPKSDHPIKDTIQDIDRILTRKSAETKKKVNDVINVAKVIAKPAQRTAGWINNIVNRFKDSDETKIKEQMADPHERSVLFKGLRAAINTGALYKAGLLLNPIFLFLAVTRTIDRRKNRTRLRTEVIGQLLAEIEITDEKIRDAASAGDNAAKYKLMRFKKEFQAKLIRVGGGKSMQRVI